MCSQWLATTTQIKWPPLVVTNQYKVTSKMCIHTFYTTILPAATTHLNPGTSLNITHQIHMYSLGSPWHLCTYWKGLYREHSREQSSLTHKILYLKMHFKVLIYLPKLITQKLFYIFASSATITPWNVLWHLNSWIYIGWIQLISEHLY